MTCQTCRARLPEHHETEDLAVARHLRECAGCRAELAALARALELLETDPAPAAPELRLGLWARIEAAERELARAAWERPIALALAALLLGWVGSLLLANWPVMMGWAHDFGGWPTVASLGAAATDALASATAGLRSDWMVSWEQALANWATAPAGPGPQPVRWMVLAAAGALVFEWTARRDLARLAPESEGAR